MPPYPLLTLLDAACDHDNPGYAMAPNAAHLERIAWDLADEHWGDNVWLTGRISPAAFQAICDALEQELSGPAAKRLIGRTPLLAARPASVPVSDRRPFLARGIRPARFALTRIPLRWVTSLLSAPIRGN